MLSPVPIFDGLQSWLNERRGSSVEVRTPQRGDLENLATLARQNAEIQLQRMATKSSGSLEQRAADEGAKTLEMQQLDHIVCFDMAQLQGDERVGASVVMRNGRPAKKEYRKYVVKGEALDDLRMMKEVVVRWAKRQEEWPDLLLIDGGKRTSAPFSRRLKSTVGRTASPWPPSPSERKPSSETGWNRWCLTARDGCWFTPETKPTDLSTPSTASAEVEAGWLTRLRAWKAWVQKNSKRCFATLADAKGLSTPRLPNLRPCPVSVRRWHSGFTRRFVNGITRRCWPCPQWTRHDGAQGSRNRSGQRIHGRPVVPLSPLLDGSPPPPSFSSSSLVDDE